MRSSSDLRKAAILIDTLSPAAADALLDQMPAAQADLVRSAVMDLDEVAADERRQVMEEFLRRGGASPRRKEAQTAPASDFEGIDFAGALMPQLASRAKRGHEPQGKSSASRVEKSAAADPTPFAFLEQTDDASLAALLEREHPQMAALVLSHLPPTRAAALLRRLSSAMREEMLRRLADLAPADPEVVRDLAAELQSLLAQPRFGKPEPEAGRAAVEAILKSFEPDERRRLVAGLGWADAADDENPSYSKSDATAPAPSAFTIPPDDQDSSWEEIATSEPIDEPAGICFDELPLLTDRALARVLQAAAPEVALLALAGAAPSLVARICNQLPPRQALEFTRQMEAIAPVRLREVEAAQHKLAAIASRLAEQGEITWPAARLAA